jgi:hypothetical protein
MQLECLYSHFTLPSLQLLRRKLTAYHRTAYDTDNPFAELLNNAMVLPIFDGGNVGIRRRHMQELMLNEDYDAWASSYGPSR